MIHKRLATTFIVAIAGVLTCPLAGAADSQFYGLLRSRDLTPFGFLRLDMQPAYAVSIEPGSWAIETELGYQNTWALSPEVERLPHSLEPQGRQRAGSCRLRRDPGTAG